MTATRSAFGTLPSGETVECIALAQPSGVTARILTLGAAIQGFAIPDAQGRIEDCVLGHDDLQGYLGTRSFFGATIGRFGNRIAGGRFTLGGETFTVPANDGPNALHGGPEGFDRRNWTVRETGAGPAPFVTLDLISPDGDQGFPGRMTARVTYRLEATGLEIIMTAECDRPCPVNMTNHAFFNLGGGIDDPARIVTAMDHHLTLPASRYLPVDDAGIPEGPPLPVDGTVFDFLRPRRIGQTVRSADPQLVRRRGYDHCLCPDGAGFRPVALLADPASGRRLTVLSDQPGLQFYSGNFLDGRTVGKGGVAYRAGDAICLEPQGFPDAPNRPDFPPSLAGPGQDWRHRMRLDFA
ncbi:MAG: aldose epimerase family protein [Paracoccaceae bacterium]